MSEFKSLPGVRATVRMAWIYIGGRWGLDLWWALPRSIPWEISCRGRRDLFWWNLAGVAEVLEDLLQGMPRFILVSVGFYDGETACGRCLDPFWGMLGFRSLPTPKI